MFVVERVESALDSPFKNFEKLDDRKSTNPFTIDSHIGTLTAHIIEFRDIVDMLHIRRIASSTEDARDLRFRVHIVRCN